MPIAGTEAVLAGARKAAKDAVKASWRALDRVLTEAEREQMQLELEQADSAAIIAHFVATATVVVASVSGVLTGGGVSGPGAGTIT